MALSRVTIFSSCVTSLLPVMRERYLLRGVFSDDALDGTADHMPEEDNEEANELGGPLGYCLREAYYGPESGACIWGQYCPSVKSFGSRQLQLGDSSESRRLFGEHVDLVEESYQHNGHQETDGD